MPIREKDHEHNHNDKVQTLTPELQAFYNELAVKFPKIRVTSAKREASQKIGKASATSRHNTGEAFDISAQDRDVADYLMNDVEGAALLTKYGLGILDETNPETMKKTGATGAHFHIGKDTKLAQQAMVRYETLSKQQPKQKPQPITLQTQIGGQPITTTVDPQEFEKEVKKEETKKEKAEEKTEKSEARKRLEEKKEKQKNFLDALQVPNSIVTYKQQKQEQYEIEEPFQLDLPDTPNQLPELPSMFQMPDVTKQQQQQNGEQFMEDGGAIKNGLKFYKYEGRPDAIYKKEGDTWLIQTEDNKQFVPIKDPTGERTKTLNKSAKPVQEEVGIEKSVNKFKTNMANAADKAWLQDWYKNREIPDSYIQGGYEMDKPLFQLRASRIPNQETVPYIERGVQGMYSNNKIKVTSDATKETYVHEGDHFINDMPSFMRTVHIDVVKNKVLPKDRIQDKWIRDNYEYYSDPDEVHARIMALRREAGFKPNEIVTPDKAINFFKKYKGGVPNIDDLMVITGTTKNALSNGLLNLLNYTAQNTTTSQPKSQTKNGGEQFMEDGGKVVSQLWKEKTGTNWEEANKQGLTDGSFEKNMELRNKLVNNQIDFEAPPQKEQPRQGTAKQYDVMVAQMVSKGSTLDDLVKQRVGTKEGLRNRFPELFSSDDKKTEVKDKKSTTPQYTLQDLFSDVKKVNWKGMTEEVVKPYTGIASTIKNATDQISSNYKTPIEKVKESQKPKITVKKKTVLPSNQKTKENKKAENSVFKSLENKISDFYKEPQKEDNFSANLMKNLTTGANTPFRQKDVNLQPIENSQASNFKNNPKAVGNKTYEPESKIQWRDFKETDLGNAIDATSDMIDIKIQQANRYLEKKGIVDTKDAKIGVKNSGIKIELTLKPKEFYEEIGTVRDVSGEKSDSLLSYRNQWDNSKGFDYYATPVKKDRTGNEKYKNTIGVGHFLLDASVSKGKNYSHENNKKFIEEAKKKDEWIPVFREKGELVNLKYKKPSEITKEDKVVTPLRQMKFEDINFYKTQQPKGFTKNVKEVTKKDGKGTYLLFKDRDGYSRFSGGSVVFIFKDKYNNTIVRDFAGSLNQIHNEGKEIQKKYKILPEDLTLGYHDVGSFSAKPKADKSGTLSAKQWEGFNTEGETGGALLIPKPKKQ